MYRAAWPWFLLALSGAQAALRPVAERLDGACGDGPPGPGVCTPLKSSTTESHETSRNKVYKVIAS
jgi:hypothetical protein